MAGRRSGLTLVEVLVALAILTLIASTTLPLLQEARAVITQRADAEIEPSELARVADLALRDPERPALGEHMVQVPAEKIPEQGKLSWPDHPEREPITFRRRVVEAVSGDHPDASHHGWIVFEWRGLALWRWYVLPDRGKNPREPRGP